LVAKKLPLHTIAAASLGEVIEQQRQFPFSLNLLVQKIPQAGTTTLASFSLLPDY